VKRFAILREVLNEKTQRLGGNVHQKLLQLTEADEERLDIERRKWIQIELSTAPADRESAEHAITELYQMTGLDRPRFLWVRSPAALMLSSVLLSGFVNFLNRREALGLSMPKQPPGLRTIEADDVLGDDWTHDFLEAFYFGEVLDQLAEQERKAFERVFERLEFYFGDYLVWELLRTILGHIARPTKLGHRSAMWEQVWMLLREDIRTHIRDQMGCGSSGSELERLWDMRTQELSQVSEGPGLSDDLRSKVFRHFRNEVRDIDDLLDLMRFDVRRGFPYWDTDTLRALLSSSGWRGSPFWSFRLGQAEKHWVITYLFVNSMKTLLAPSQVRVLQLWLTIMRSCGWWWPWSNLVIISERPEWISYGGEGQKTGFHCEHGPAIRFRDGFALWRLNGIPVDREVVETPADRLDPRIIFTEENADVRREIVRKIGIDRVCAALVSEVLDSTGAYELVNLNLGDGRTRPYLKMLNPSTGTWHLEGVPPDVTTVSAALRWRNRTDEPPQVLT